MLSEDTDAFQDSNIKDDGLNSAPQNDRRLKTTPCDCFIVFLNRRPDVTENDVSVISAPLGSWWIIDAYRVTHTATSNQPLSCAWDFTSIRSAESQRGCWGLDVSSQDVCASQRFDSGCLQQQWHFPALGRKTGQDESPPRHCWISGSVGPEWALEHISIVRRWRGRENK